MPPFEHILIVDDNPDDRALIFRQVRIEEPGAVVSEARNFDELHDRLSGAHVDLVITDYQLNWASGLDVLRIVKDQQPDCQVIMFTASGTEEIAVTAMKNGVQDYILKSPENLERLRTSIRQTFITAQQRKALEAAQYRYKELFQGIPIGLYQTSPEGKFMEVNQAMVKMLGYPNAESLMSVETRDLYVHPDHYNKWKHATNEIGEVRGLEVEMWCYDRSVIWVEINGKPVFKDGVFQYNEGSVQDISERVKAVQDLQRTASHAETLARNNAELYDQLQKHSRQLEKMIDERTKELKREVQIRIKSEEDLKLSQSSYKAVVDRVREAICKLDEDGVIRFVNPAWEHITGFDTPSTLGQPFLDFFSGHTRDELQEQFYELYSMGLKHVQILVPMENKTNGTRWVEVYFEVDKNTVGEVNGLFVMIYDVTDRKLANDEISRAYSKEKELSHLRSQFVSMTSHEFRTPLASILTSSELLQHYGHRWTREKNDIHHKRIQDSVKQIISLMDDILIIGKADAGKLKCEKEKMDAVELTRMILEEIRLNTHDSHRMVFDSESDTDYVFMDRKLYRQILTNIVTNALKYSEKGSTVWTSLVVSGRELVFKVQDEGIGIPDQDIRQLFHSFFRAGNVGDTPGTGLGMPIVKRSVDAHKGTVSIESKENVGTTVTITLDVSEPE